MRYKETIRLVKKALEQPWKYSDAELTYMKRALDDAILGLARKKFDKKKKKGSDMRILTLEREKMLKVLEDIIAKKSKDTDIQKKDTISKIDDLPVMIKKNLKTLLKHMEKNDISKQDLIKVLKNEQ